MARDPPPAASPSGSGSDGSGAAKGDEGPMDTTFERGAKWLLARGVHPNHFTFLQLPVFLIEIEAALRHWRLTFALSTLLVIVLDGGDGILARVGRLKSRTGAVLDSTFDTLGIAIILWGASQFVALDHPEHAALYTQWLMLLFFASIVLLLQNALLDEKMVGYLRGPIVIGVALPEVFFGGLVVPSVVIGFLLAVRAPAMFRAMARHVQLP